MAGLEITPLPTLSRIGEGLSAVAAMFAIDLLAQAGKAYCAHGAQPHSTKMPAATKTV